MSIIFFVSVLFSPTISAASPLQCWLFGVPSGFTAPPTALFRAGQRYPLVTVIGFPYRSRILSKAEIKVFNFTRISGVGVLSIRLAQIGRHPHPEPRPGRHRCGSRGARRRASGAVAGGRVRPAGAWRTLLWRPRAARCPEARA